VKRLPPRGGGQAQVHALADRAFMQGVGSVA